MNISELIEKLEEKKKEVGDVLVYCSGALIMNTIKEYWKDYKKAMNMDIDSPVTTEKRRLAFYAGAMAATLLQKEKVKEEVLEDINLNLKNVTTRN